MSLVRLLGIGLTVSTLLAGTGTVRSQPAPSAPPLGRDGMPMLAVPAGPFMMGAAGGPAAGDEGPPRGVTLGAFHIDEHEVSNAQFARFVADTGHVTLSERVGHSHGFVDGIFQRIDGAGWRAPEGPGSTIEERMDHPDADASTDRDPADANSRGVRSGSGSRRTLPHAPHRRRPERPAPSRAP